MADLEILTLELGPAMTNAYVVGGPASLTAVVIDPAWSGGKILSAAQEKGWEIKAVWLTHAHFDHFGGAAELLQSVDGSIDIANLVVPLLARASLGGFRIDFFTQNDHVIASVEDTDGVIDLAGSLQINRDKSYSFRGLVVSKPNTPESLRQRIQYLPQTDQPGQHELALDGSY